MAGIPFYRVFVVEKRPLPADQSFSTGGTTSQQDFNFSSVDNQASLRDEASTPQSRSDTLYLDKDNQSKRGMGDALEVDYEEKIIGLFYYFRRISHNRYDALYPVAQNFQFEGKVPNRGRYCHFKDNYEPDVNIENPKPGNTQQQAGNTIIEYRSAKLGNLKSYGIIGFGEDIDRLVQTHVVVGTLRNTPEVFKKIASDLLDSRSWESTTAAFESDKRG